MDPCKSAQLGCAMRLAIIMLSTAVDDVEAGLYGTEELAEQADALRNLADAMQRKRVQVVDSHEVSQ